MTVLQYVCESEPTSGVVVEPDRRSRRPSMQVGDRAGEIDRNIIVPSGATEALADSLMALLAPGDEAIILEPAYDSYRPVIEAAGARCVAVCLDAPDWSLSEEALAAAFSSRTKLIILNSPMNPTGKVFSEAELDLIAELLVRHDAYAVCDEVYEHLTFSGHRHIPLMTRPGMAERTVRIGSAGKTFSLTGWKVGYITAPAALADVIAKTHQFVTFTTAPALQTAIAQGLGFEDSYFDGLALDLEGKRERLAQGLEGVGFRTLPTHGTYFLTCDISALRESSDDRSFCMEITRQAGVAAVPVSAFYADPESAPRNLVRFCFCKEDRILDEAVRRLQDYLGKVAA